MKVFVFIWCESKPFGCVCEWEEVEKKKKIMGNLKMKDS